MRWLIKVNDEQHVNLSQKGITSKNLNTSIQAKSEKSGDKNSINQTSMLLLPHKKGFELKPKSFLKKYKTNFYRRLKEDLPI